jgi:hypothetical protein
VSVTLKRVPPPAADFSSSGLRGMLRGRRMEKRHDSCILFNHDDGLLSNEYRPHRRDGGKNFLLQLP